MSDEFEVSLQMPSTDAGAESRPTRTHVDKPAGPTGDNPATPPPDSTTAIREQRVISETTRKAMAKIADLAKRADAVDLGDDLVPMEHDPNAAKPAPTTPARAAEAQAQAAAPAAQPAAAPAAQSAAPQPAAEPSMSAAAAAAAEITARAEAERIRGEAQREHETRMKALDAREQALAAREKLVPNRADLFEKPGASLYSLVSNALGLGENDGAEIKQALGDLITLASVEHMGVVLPPEVISAIESRRTRNYGRVLRQDLDAREAALRTERENARKADETAAQQRQQQEREREAIALVRDMTGKTRETHPFLHAASELGILEGDPHNVVVELIRQQRARGEPANFEAAVKAADDYFRPKVTAALDRSAALKPKLSPQPATPAAPAATAAPATQQVGEQVPRPKTLTTTPTQPAATDAAPDEGPEFEDRQDRRRRMLRGTFAKHRSRFTVADS